MLTVWANLRPKLEVLLAEEKQRRINVRYAKRREKRRKQIGRYYEAFLAHEFTAAERVLMPNTYTAVRLPVLEALAEKDNANGPVPRQDFYAVRPELRAQAEEYKQEYRSLLAETLAEEISTCSRHLPSSIVRKTELKRLRNAPADKLLQHPMAVFQCSLCSQEDHEMFAYPELHEHWRETHPDQPWSQDEFCNGKRRVTPMVFIETASLVGAILNAIGLSENLTLSELTALVQSGRLYCACGDPSLPLPTELSWVKLASTRPTSSLSSSLD